MVDLTRIKRIAVVDARGDWGYLDWDDTAAVRVDLASTAATIDHRGVHHALGRTAPTPVVRPVAARLSGVVWTQRYPIGTNSKFVMAVGYLTPIGGVGPFLFVVTDPTGKYRLAGDTLRTSETVVGAADDVLTAYAIDGRGDRSPPISFTIRKTDVDGLGLNTRNPLPSFSPVWSGVVRPDAAPTFGPAAYGPAHVDIRQDAVGVVDPSNTFVASGGTVRSQRGTPAPGSYPVTFTSQNAVSKDVQTLAETLVIGPVPSIDLVEFVPTKTWSTATAPGTVIGLVAATAPDNAPQFSIVHPLLAVDPATREVRVLARPAAPGPVRSDLTVASGGTALTRTVPITVNVVVGTILDPAAMSLKLNPLDNSTPGQRVGQLGVEGQSGGSWVILSQSGFNPLATTGQYGRPARYQVDGAGLVHTPPDCLLSYQNPAYGWETDQLDVVWTSDDGLTVCQRTFPIPVSEAPERLIFVGPGMAAAHPGVGYDTLTAAIALCGRYHPGIKYRLKCTAAADPDYYTDATRSQRQGIIGPVALDVADLANPPRGGGRADLAASVNAATGTTGGNKGAFLFSHGDAEFIGWRVSNVHGNDSSHGLEAVRKDGNTDGNLAVLDGELVDSEQGLESGVGHGYIFVQRLKVRRCGGASVGAGLTHGFYVGTFSKFELVDSYVDDTPWGHLVKSRAVKTILRRNRIYDTGSAACCLDLPNGGDVLLEDNEFVKRPFATNPAIVNFGAEGGVYRVNRLVSRGNRYVGTALSYGGNFGPIVALMHYHLPGDAPSTVSSAGDSFFIPPRGLVTMEYAGYAKDGVTTVTNPTMLTLPPPLDPLPPLTNRPYRRRFVLDPKSEFPNFNGVPILASTFKLEPAGPGPVVTLTPTGDVVGGVDPFAMGWSSALVRDGIYDHSDPWAPDGAFVLDGGNLIYKGGLAPGLYFVQPQFRSADGKTLANGRLPVTIGRTGLGAV